MQHLVKLFLLSISFSLTLQAQTWSNNGPFGGYITAVAVDPVDTNIVYAGTFGSGIYRSSDGGLNWSQFNKDFPERIDSSIGAPHTPSWWFGDYFTVTTIKISAHNPARIYVGTDNAGIVQSDNLGVTWIMTNAGLPDSAIISAIWIHPEDSTFLLCGTSLPHGGLYRSTDSGLSWVLVDGVPHNATYYITTITNNSEYPDSIFVGFSSAGEPGLSWGLLRSPDRANSWEIVANDFSFHNLQIDPLNTRNLWSVISTGYGDWMLFYSNDAGISWNSYPDIYQAWTWVLGMYSDSEWNLYVIDCEENLLRKSTDRGVSWSSFPISLPFCPIGMFLGSDQNITANPLHTETVYFGTEAAVYRSDNGGETYEIKDNNMKNTYINDVAVNPDDPQILYAGGDQGLWKSIDGGNNWIRLSTSSVNAIAIDPQYPDTLYWGGEDLMRSFDGGITREVILQLGSVTAIEIHPDSSNKLFVGLYPSTLYMSEDWGYNWDISYTPPHGTFRITDIAVDKTNPNNMYFGAGGTITGLYKSTDSGSSWIRISDPGTVISIALHTTNSETVFISTYSQIKVSYDGGVSFQEIGQSIPSNNMSEIVIDPVIPSHLFVGTKNKGIFYSINSGQNWYSLPGEYDPRIVDIDLVTTRDQIYIGTHISGVWRGDDIVLSAEDDEDGALLPETVTLLPIYPNPFNNQTIIPFHISAGNEMELAIYNIQGKLIKKFDRKFYSAGYHQVYWYGEDNMNRQVVSGVYFVLLRSSTKSSVSKIVLLK